MHNPATRLLTSKDFDTMHKSAQPSKLCDTQLSTRFPLYCHAIDASLIHLTMPMTTVALHNAVILEAALTVALAVVHPVVIGITMTATAVAHLILIIIPMMVIMTFIPPTQPIVLCPTTSLLPPPILSPLPTFTLMTPTSCNWNPFHQNLLQQQPILHWPTVPTGSQK